MEFQKNKRIKCKMVVDTDNINTIYLADGCKTTCSFTHKEILDQFFLLGHLQAKSGDYVIPFLPEITRKEDFGDIKTNYRVRNQCDICALQSYTFNKVEVVTHQNMSKQLGSNTTDPETVAVRMSKTDIINVCNWCTRDLLTQASEFISSDTVSPHFVAKKI